MLLLHLALRNILRQRRRSVLTGLSMAGGYLLLTFSLSLVEGSYSGIIHMFTRDFTGHVQVHAGDHLRRPSLYKTIDDRAALEALLDTTRGIAAWTPRIDAPALAHGERRSAPARVIGIDVEREQQTSLLKDKVRSGRFPTATPNRDGMFDALIGRSLADSLALDTGDELVLISQGADGSVANDLYLVSGIIGTRSSRERNSVFLPLAAAEDFLSLHGRAHVYVLLLDDYRQARDIAAELSAQAGQGAMPDWHFALTLPAVGWRSSSFGSLRILNGRSRSSHSGVSSAPTGVFHQGVFYRRLRV